MQLAFLQHNGKKNADILSNAKKKMSRRFESPYRSASTVLLFAVVVFMAQVTGPPKQVGIRTMSKLTV